MEEVKGSIPFSSTRIPRSEGLGIFRFPPLTSGVGYVVGYGIREECLEAAEVEA
jgi:hypothetical protein